VSEKENGLKLIEVSTSEGGLLVPYELRRSRRSRYLRLSVGVHNHALVSVPWRCSHAEAMQFLRSQGDWLAKHLETSRRQQSLLEFLLRQPRLYAGGQTLRLDLRLKSPRNGFSIDWENARVTFNIGSGNDREEELISVTRAFAKKVITDRVTELAARHELEVARVTVRDQSSRWGSCSSRRTLSLNWRLVLLRAELQDHVIYHELAHLTELNHSPRFWALLKKYDPRTERHNRLLNSDAARLMPLARLQAKPDHAHLRRVTN